VPTTGALSRTLLGIGYLILVIAAGGLVTRRGETIVRGVLQGGAAIPYMTPLMRQEEVRSIRDSIARGRMQRIDFAIQVYYLRNRGYPENLARLVTEHLLKPAAILDPLGRPFKYEVLPGGYKISFSPMKEGEEAIEMINAPAR
jgi:hypothetical protein